MILDKISSPKDLKKLNFDELNALAEEIRSFLIGKVSELGGHLASNLGVVELTLALHYFFNTPYDKIIWDVGHQSYIHKIICGRRDLFDSLRQKDGLSGFPKISESEYDTFNAGHAGTSLSLALGLALAKEQKNDDFEIVPVIGDASFANGINQEALNHLSHCGKKIIIILNDNQMSIQESIGAFSKYLNKIRTNPIYFDAKGRTKKVFSKIPLIGSLLYKITSKFSKLMKFIFVPGIYFEKLGCKYLGPFDGHDIQGLCTAFSQAKKYEKPCIVHVCTKKGKGYDMAEKAPSNFHAVSSSKKVVSGKTMTQQFGETLTGLAEKNPMIYSISPAMPVSCGLGEFIKKFPERFSDAGIAEEHAVTMAAGLAHEGFIPVVSIYSTFLQRAYDSLIEDIALANYHVVFAIDHAGVTGADGETHQGVFDISFLSHIPNMTVLAPCCNEELDLMLKYAVNNIDGPVAIRYPKGPLPYIDTHFNFAKAEVLKEGNDVTIVSYGRMLYEALIASDILMEQGVSAEVINMSTVKPFDKESVLKSVSKTGFLVTVEDNMEFGSLGEKLKADIIKAFPDEFIPHGLIDELIKAYRLDGKSIAEDILRRLQNEDKA